MSALRVWVEGVGIVAPGLSDWPSAAAVLRGEQPYAAAPLDAVLVARGALAVAALGDGQKRAARCGAARADERGRARGGGPMRRAPLRGRAYPAHLPLPRR